MDGPVGVSHCSELQSPNETDSTAIAVAKRAICSGLFEILRAAAAGIINNDVIRRMPTIFIATAMTMAIKSIKVNWILAVGTPSTCASSSCIESAKRGCQIKNSIVSTHRSMTAIQ